MDAIGDTPVASTCDNQESEPHRFGRSCGSLVRVEGVGSCRQQVWARSERWCWWLLADPVRMMLARRRGLQPSFCRGPKLRWPTVRSMLSPSCADASRIVRTEYPYAYNASGLATDATTQFTGEDAESLGGGLFSIRCDPSACSWGSASTAARAPTPPRSRSLTAPGFDSTTRSRLSTLLRLHPGATVIPPDSERALAVYESR